MSLVVPANQSSLPHAEPANHSAGTGYTPRILPYTAYRPAKVARSLPSSTELSVESEELPEEEEDPLPTQTMEAATTSDPPNCIICRARIAEQALMLKHELVITFRCGPCRRIFCGMHGYMNHSHPPAFPCFVKDCSLLFDTPLGVQNHVSEAHPICKLCNEPAKFGIYQHIIQMHGYGVAKSLFSLELQNTPFSVGRHLAVGNNMIQTTCSSRHRECVAVIPRWTKPLLPKDAIAATHLVNDIHGEELLKRSESFVNHCELCDIEYSNNEYPSSHKFLKKCTCSFCSEVFCSKQLFYLHMVQFHLDKTDFPCGLCLMTFSTSFEMQHHIFSAHHSVHCDRCNIFLRDINDFKLHLKHAHMGKCQPNKAKVGETTSILPSSITLPPPPPPKPEYSVQFRVEGEGPSVKRKDNRDQANHKRTKISNSTNQNTDESHTLSQQPQQQPHEQFAFSTSNGSDSKVLDDEIDDED